MQAIKFASPRSFILLDSWIPIISPEKSLSSLRPILANAMSSVGVQQDLIDLATARDGPFYPGGYQGLSPELSLHRFVIEVINLRRLNQSGPIFLHYKQAWQVAEALIGCCVAFPSIRGCAPACWGEICENFIPTWEEFKRFGDFADGSSFVSDWTPLEDRECQYSSVRCCVQDIVQSHVQPLWMAESVKPFLLNALRFLSE